MEKLMLAVLCILLSTHCAANQSKVIFNETLGINQIELPKGISEKDLLDTKKNLLPDSVFATKKINFEYSDDFKKRVINPSTIIDVLKRLPNEPSRKILIETLRKKYNQKNEDCLEKGNLFAKAFYDGGDCKNGSCILNGVIPDSVKQLAIDFDNSCKSEINNPGYNERLSQTIAIFINDVILCSGHFNGSVITTARHCFYNGKTLKDNLYTTEILQTDAGDKIAPIQFQFSLLNDTNTRHTTRALFKTESKIDDLDVITISFGEQSIPLFNSAKIESSVEIPVVNQFIINSYKEIHHALREYQNPSCQIIAKSNTCILHTCTTLPTMSGSPVYQNTNSGNTIPVGIHVGTLDEAYSDSCKSLDEMHLWKFKNGDVNVAVPINKNSTIQNVKAVII